MCLRRFLHTVIWCQVFLSNPNNLHTVIWFQSWLVSCMFYGRSTHEGYLMSIITLYNINNIYICIYVHAYRACSKSNKACVMWYATERGKVKINSPTLCVWTNKSQEWPLKGRYELKSNYLHSMTNNQLDREGNVGHWVAWLDEIERRRKEAKWLARAFAPKIVPFNQRKSGRGCLVLGHKSAWKDVLIY